MRKLSKAIIAVVIAFLVSLLTPIQEAHALEFGVQQIPVSRDTQDCVIYMDKTCEYTFPNGQFDFYFTGTPSLAEEHDEIGIRVVEDDCVWHETGKASIYLQRGIQDQDMNLQCDAKRTKINLETYCIHGRATVTAYR
ncbi:MAG: hypothetical protein F6K22_15965 [Okeania sp. SIO2F4]|uniref:hypothetical protein n=1 Tax=Okeania sp. SIO2F4 TaxID=2607790 RepID=UPI00142CB04A|nr:hypothetical protein [Okeania sp. SIO2F4]NES04198.1 hypothetical protein [Okeania sp. SIO2F4]